MRGLPARRIASSALCAALLVGIAAPAALAADGASAREQRVQAAAHAPVLGADALLAPVKSLGDLGTVLTPVTDLLNAVLKADSGRLPAADVGTLGKAATDALAKVSAAVPAAPATPALPATSAASPAPALPATPALPVLPTLAKNSGDAKPRAAAGLIGDALAALQKAIDALLQAVTSGDVTQVAPAATSVVTGLVSTVTATLLGGNLPAVNLPGLPMSTPSLSATPPLPVA
ncbi:hypothetical protein [Streptomyces sp. SLBN-8D4]|jgi:hypothetical protein|uniref:hypothetical protein n=1 Tax=Streptomyces sp. SLBN-8D4 TaxID=3377728 RepID=UPI003C7BF327